MTPFDRHLQAAQGYLELGLPLEANEEIKSIEPELKTLFAVLGNLPPLVPPCAYCPIRTR